MAISSAMVWEVRNGGNDTSGGGFRGGANLSTPSAPVVTPSASGGTVAANTYYVVVTLTDGNGETPKSAETSVVTSGATASFTVTAPTNPNIQGATWSIYVGTTSGGPYFSQSTGNLFTANKIVTATPPTTGTQAPGVDYSQQSGAQVVINNTTITCTTTGANSNTLTFTAGYTPTAADVGNVVNITAGTNLNTGRYEITGWSSTTWTVSGAANLTTAGGAGSAITGNMGGALVSPAVAAGSASSGQQNGIFVKYNATPYAMSASTNVANGSISSNNPGWIVGYDTTRDRNNTDANRPTLQASANSVTLVASTKNNGIFANVILDANGKTSVTGSIYVGGPSQTWRVKALNCATGFNINNGTNILVGCEANGCTTGYTGTGLGLCVACTAISCGTTGFNVSSSAGTCVNCVATGCGTNFIAAGNYITFVGCTAYGSTIGAGFLVNSSGPTGYFVNCVAYSNHTYGFAGQAIDGYLVNCAAGANLTAAALNEVAARMPGFITLTADPFTNAAGNDFSLNTTVGGGAALRAAGYPSTLPGLSTNNYLDIGAVQHPNPASTVFGSGLFAGGKL